MGIALAAGFWGVFDSNIRFSEFLSNFYQGFLFRKA
jgi:hypothetical protein